MLYVHLFFPLLILSSKYDHIRILLPMILLDAERLAERTRNVCLVQDHKVNDAKHSHLVQIYLFNQTGTS